MAQKKPKTMWLPKKFLADMSSYFEERKEVLEQLGITSVVELIRRLSYLGKPRLRRWLQLIDAFEESDEQAIQEILGQIHKLDTESEKP